MDVKKKKKELVFAITNVRKVRIGDNHYLLCDLNGKMMRGTEAIATIASEMFELMHEND